MAILELIKEQNYWLAMKTYRGFLQGQSFQTMDGAALLAIWGKAVRLN